MTSNFRFLWRYSSHSLFSPALSISFYAWLEIYPNTLQYPTVSRFLPNFLFKKRKFNHKYCVHQESKGGTGQECETDMVTSKRRKSSVTIVYNSYFVYRVLFQHFCYRFLSSCRVLESHSFFLGFAEMKLNFTLKDPWELGF